MNRYMRDNLLDKYGFIELQDKMLEIMVYVDDLCKKNNIDYCLMGGSALGAKRHGGFIPWDDDLDIFMTPDNYEKFAQVFNSQADKNKYYLQKFGETDNMVTMAKVRMNNTTYIEEQLKHLDMHHGIYIDIFILHICPNNKILQLHQCFWAKYLVLKGLSNKGYTKRKGIISIILKLLRLFPNRFLVKHALKQVYKYRCKNTNYYCNFLGKAIFRKGIYKKEWMEKTRYTNFEKIQLKIPQGLESFLTDRFGDYMQIPSESKIKWEQHAWKWDTKKDFRKYLDNINDYRDEKILI